MGKTLWALLLCALWIGAKVALAQPARGPEAEALFLDGKAAMSSKAYDIACAKFTASHKLEPRASTLMNLGACHEAAGRIVSAWYAFADAVELSELSTVAPERALVDAARARERALAARRSSVTIVVSEAMRVEGLVVSRDGHEIVDAQWNSPIYLDGGRYTFATRAPGVKDWSVEIVVARELDHQTIEVPPLRARDQGGRASDAASAAPDSRSDARDVAPGTSSIMTTRRRVAIGVSIAGGAAIAAGVAFAINARSKQSQSDAVCPDTRCGSAEGLQLNEDARSAAMRANILWAVGGSIRASASASLWDMPRSYAHGPRLIPNCQVLRIGPENPAAADALRSTLNAFAARSSAAAVSSSAARSSDGAGARGILLVLLDETG